MPITQDRMIALIRAARDYKDALEATKLYVRRCARIVKEGKSSAAEQLEYLDTIIDPIAMMGRPHDFQ